MFYFESHSPAQVRLPFFGNIQFNQSWPNWGLHLTPLRGAGEAGR